MVGVPSSCALLGGFAIGARVSLLRQLAPNAKCQRVRVLALLTSSQISESAVVTAQRRTQRDRAIVSMNVVGRLFWFPADMPTDRPPSDIDVVSYRVAQNKRHFHLQYQQRCQQ